MGWGNGHEMAGPTVPARGLLDVNSQPVDLAYGRGQVTLKLQFSFSQSDG